MKPLIDFGSEEQKRRLLPRIADGRPRRRSPSPSRRPAPTPPAMRTRFTPDGDDIVVDGGKTFITSGDVVGSAAGVRQVERDRRRQGRHLGAGAGEGHARLLDRAAPRTRWGCAPRPRWRSTSTSAACRAPTCWAQPGDGLKILLASLNKSRPSIAAHALGIATAAFKDMTAYMNTRRQSGRRIAEFQGNQFLLADLASELAMCEALARPRGRPGRRRRDRHRHRGLDRQAARLRPRHAHDHRGRADARRLRLYPRLSRRAPDARRQDHPDLGRHQPGAPPADRTELRRRNERPIKTVAVCGAGGTMGAGIAIVAARAGFSHHLLRRRRGRRWSAPRGRPTASSPSRSSAAR